MLLGGCKGEYYIAVLQLLKSQHVPAIAQEDLRHITQLCKRGDMDWT